MLIVDEKLFTNKNSGTLEWVQEGMYYRFNPKKLPVTYIPSSKVLRQQTMTVLALGELKGLSQKFTRQEIKLLQFPFMIKEAQLSSWLEGTRSTITDVFKSKKIEEKDTEKRLDNEEINNYEIALNYGLTEQKIISEDLIKLIHKILLKGVRGEDKDPGKYKEKQNAVGNRDDTLDSAKFVPASPELTPELMRNLIEFINSNEYEPLFKMAITHYQFEAIHPFRDGNGRLGRLLIILQLCRENILSHPVLYISEYFNRNRDTYTDSLFNVSSKGNIEAWIMFFLKALEYQANQSIKLLTRLQNYKLELQSKMHELSQSPNMHLLIDSLFRSPFISVKDVMKPLKITQPAAWSLLKKLKELGIIREAGMVKRTKLYIAQKIIEIIEGKE